MAESAQEYLKSHFVLVLATAGTDGAPHAAPMLYAPDGGRVYVWAPDDSRTAKNLGANPRAAVAVAETPADWTNAQSLQLDGQVKEVEGDEARAGDIFAERYPFLGDAARRPRYWRFDAAEVTVEHGGGAGDAHFEALGQEWEREDVPVDKLTD